jgi:hypothetical protein
VCIVCGCRKSLDPGAGADPADLLPENDDISGFQKKGSAAVMTDYQSIMDAIDGAAEKYIDYGFVEGAQQMFSNGSVDIDVQILNHSSAENAEGIFNEFYPSSPEVLSSGNPKVVIEHALLTGYTLYYMRDNIFIQIFTFDKSNFSLNMAKQFYLNIDRKIASN